MISLEGRVALITGASSGIGAAAARLFAIHGAKVVLAARRIDELTRVTREIKDVGGDALAVRTDVSRSADVQNLILETLDAFGRLDYCFNNAGIANQASLLDEFSEEEFDEVVAVNLKGVFLCLKYQLPVMRAKGGGAIVNMSSVLGLRAYRKMGPYVASKHGVEGLTKLAAIENASFNIRVNAISPGTVATPMIDRIVGGDPEKRQQISQVNLMRRAGTPEEIAETVLWLCSDKASYMTGQSVTVDGGLML